MNFKNEKPDLFRMMGEYYKLMEELYVSMDIREVIQKCDVFRIVGLFGLWIRMMWRWLRDSFRASLSGRMRY